MIMSSILEKYSHNLPVIDIQTENGIFDFSGISNIENAEAFEPTFDLIKRYVQNPAPKTVINCRFEYFNTATSRLLMEMFDLFEKAHNQGNNVIVNWHYNSKDIDMKDSGVLYQELSDLPFQQICSN